MSTPLLRVHLFGRFEVECDEGPLAGLDAARVQELFSYLLLHRRRPHARELLADRLQGEGPAARSRKGLRQALWQLQTALDSAVRASDEHVLLVAADTIQVNPLATPWLDVAVFEEACKACASVPGAALDAEQAQDLDRAVTLYQGDLLEGWYQDWCLFERERLQNIFITTLDKLMAYCTAHGIYERGVAYGVRALRRDRARERTHRWLMRLHYLAGDRTAALRQYALCVAALDEELGVAPARSTLTLYEEIRDDALTSYPADPSFEAAPAAGALPALLQRLKQLSTTLGLMQDQVRHELEAAERALANRR